MTNNLKTTVLSSLLWKILETSGTQLIGFIIGVILARLLLPEDFGALALIMVFTTFANIFIDSGFSTALVQKKNADNLDYSSVFYLSLVIALICYIILFVSAPFIAEFYNLEILTPAIRVLGLTLIIRSLAIVQYAYIQQHFLFKKLFACNITSLIISSIIGLYMAFTGWGLWSLVWQQLSGAIVSTLTLLILIRWIPKYGFSFERTKTLFSFGGKLLISNIISTIYTQATPILLGKAYSTESLGYFTKGQQIPQLIAGQIINSAIQAVLFPAFSQNQDEHETVKNIMKRSLKTSAFVVYPCLFGIAAVAEPFVLLLFTEKWAACIPFLQMFCIYYLLWPVHTVNNQATTALGKSGIYLRNQIIALILSLTALIITIQISIYAVVIGMIITTIICSTIIMIPNKKLVGYSVKEQIKDLLPPTLLSLLMFICVYPISFLPLHPLVMLLIQVPIGILIYIGLAYLFKLETFTYIVRTINEYRRKE